MQLALFPDDPLVRFEPSGASVRVPPGTPLIDAAERAGLPVAQSCGRWAVCGWCRMEILEGLENLSPADDVEQRLAVRQRFAPNVRASCQATVLGDVVATASYW